MALGAYILIAAVSTTADFCAAPIDGGIGEPQFCSLGGVQEISTPYFSVIISIEEEIRTLSAFEQETLLRALWQEVDGPPDDDVEATWLEEVHRRGREIDEGRVELVPADQVFRMLGDSVKK